MPEAFVEGLDAQVRTKMATLLNARLADAVDLTLAVKQAHWNVKGPGFIGFHELLDEVADRLREHVDLMAERAVILGGHARGTLNVAAKETTLEAYPVELQDLQGHVDALKARFMDLGEKIRKAMDEAGEAGDEDTADLFTEVSRAIDKDAWFIGAHGAQT
ncbi:DNA starvation/stationary phase protection protein Dps [Aestuariibius insulae]|uniref:DNA starvation/stationary phase protection protein Dps n=1 Tax=Aestuariibius insulae TaxID=2058287 RepID=UPI00345EF5BE